MSTGKIGGGPGPFNKIKDTGSLEGSQTQVTKGNVYFGDQKMTVTQLPPESKKELPSMWDHFSSFMSEGFKSIKDFVLGLFGESRKASVPVDRLDALKGKFEQLESNPNISHIGKASVPVDVPSGKADVQEKDIGKSIEDIGEGLGRKLNFVEKAMVAHLTETMKREYRPEDKDMLEDIAKVEVFIKQGTVKSAELKKLDLDKESDLIKANVELPKLKEDLALVKNSMGKISQVLKQKVKEGSSQDKDIMSELKFFQNQVLAVGRSLGRKGFGGLNSFTLAQDQKDLKEVKLFIAHVTTKLKSLGVKLD